MWNRRLSKRAILDDNRLKGQCISKRAGHPNTASVAPGIVTTRSCSRPPERPRRRDVPAALLPWNTPERPHDIQAPKR